MRVNPSPARRIDVNAYDGGAIPNLIGFDPTPWAISAQRSFLDRVPMLGYREMRREPTGRYNCHGLVFASRRTQVDNPELPVDILDLLVRDLYRITEEPQPGDIVVYRSETAGQGVDHSGVVLRIDLGSVYVLSKWGGFEEYEHLVTACPFHGAVEYWTLRE